MSRFGEFVCLSCCNGVGMGAKPDHTDECISHEGRWPRVMSGLLDGPEDGWPACPCCEEALRLVRPLDEDDQSPAVEVEDEEIEAVSRYLDQLRNGEVDSEAVVASAAAADVALRAAYLAYFTVDAYPRELLIEGDPFRLSE